MVLGQGFKSVFRAAGGGLIFVFLSFIPASALDGVLSDSGSTLELTDISLVETESGKVNWRLSARKVYFFVSGRKAQFLQPRVLVYRESQAIPAFTLTCLRGELDLDTNNMRLRGGVRMVSSEGLELVTEGLDWLSSEKRIVSTRPVKISGTGWTISGERLVADVELQVVRVLGHTETVIGQAL